MKSEDKLLLACTRQDFLDSHRQTVLDACREHEIRWDVAYQTADLHGVAPLVYRNLLRCPTQDLGIPGHILDQFKLCLVQNMLRKERLAKNIVGALAYFGERSIDVMLIKGAALDILVYDQPYYTASQDADLVIGVRREEISDGQYREFMHFLHRTGIEYECFEHHDVLMNGALPIDFHRIWEEATRTEFRGQEVIVMSPEDMLLSVCVNSCRKRFFRLKSLCDIAEITYRYPDLQWGDLTEKARAYDCNNIVYAALLVTKSTVGGELPDEVLENLAAGRVRSAVIREIVRYVRQHMSLDSLYPLSGRQILSRQVGLSLILPYTTLHGYQIWRRIAFVVGPNTIH